MSSVKEQFVYGGKAGQDIPCFDATKPLPTKVQPTRRYLANFGMQIISARKLNNSPPSPPPSAIQQQSNTVQNSFPSFLGMNGVLQERNPATKEITKPGAMELLDSTVYMYPNLTRCRPDKFSDDFFVERRLNGFNPGQMKPVQGKPWHYIINYDYSKYAAEPSGILPATIGAIFRFDGQRLHPHSIEWTLNGKTEKQQPGDSNWEWAKKLFRNAEFIYHEIRTHLGQCHMNMDQYAMAYYRNIVNNPIQQLLEPHLEGLLNINKEGSGLIIGKTGFIPDTSPLTPEQVDAILKEEITGLTYRNYHPKKQSLPDYIVNNHFDIASQAMWEAVEAYVSKFFAANKQGIESNWSEVKGMSEDLVTRSILKPELATLAINSINDLQQLCVYIIYHCTFLHSWVNNKQYEDGGDVEYATMGLWDKKHPGYKQGTEEVCQAKQVLTMWSLSSLRYNPIIAVTDGLAKSLRDEMWKRRHLIQPGIPLEDIMMSVNI